MKKKVFVSVLAGLLMFVSVGCGLSTTRDINFKIDALSYDMKLSLDTKKERLEENVTMEFVNKSVGAVDELYIRNMASSVLDYDKTWYEEGNGKKKCKVKEITYNGKSASFDYGNDESIISVKLEEPLELGKTGEINIKMYTDVPDRYDRFGVVTKDIGKIYCLSFCFPYLADNQMGEWILDPYFDDGESRSYDLADYTVEFTTDKDYVVAATGNEETKNGKTTISAENVRDFAIVASNYITKDSFDVDGITVNNYLFEGKGAKIYKNLTEKVAIDSINRYQECIGEYPYDSLDIIPAVFGFAYGGMEYPMLVMTNATSFYEGGKLMDPWGLSSGLSHEIGHQWFYASVGNREYTEAWLDEAFTTYLEKDIFGLYNGDAYKYTRKVDYMFPSIEDSKEMRDEAIESARKDFKDYKINMTPDDYGLLDSYGAVEYEGGYAFLQEIRKEMGNEKFDKFLKDYYKKYTLDVSTTKDVLELIRKYDNSEKINEIISFYINEE